MISLRALALEDAPRLLAWRNDPPVSAYMYEDHQITAAEHQAWLERALAAEDRRYWIIQLDGAPVGLANFVDISRRHASASWAFYLADPATRGRGVGLGVEYFMLAQAFDTLKLNRLYCEVLAFNEAVIAMHKSVGFSQEALFRQRIHKQGGFHDVVGLSLLADDWPAAKAGLEAKMQAKSIAVPRQVS